MSIVFLTKGILTTIQDLGRNGFRRLGVNPNGAMDRTALRLTNILLDNDENEAALEIHFPAPQISFEKDALISLGGADFGARIDNQPIENWQTFWIKKGQTLSFQRRIWGHRLYLSVKGGLHIKAWLGSQSTNLKAQIGGFEGRNLEKNDRIFFKVKIQNSKVKKNLKISPFFLPDYQSSHPIRLIEGAEFNLLTPFSSENFIRQSFTLSRNSDRMGFRLTGNPLYLLHEKELVSSAVSFGTIQLLPDGQMIILMADHQTTGGYPRIANVIAQDLPILAQLGTNDKLKFEVISLQAAEDLALKFERELSFLKTGINLYAFN